MTILADALLDARLDTLLADAWIVQLAPGRNTCNNTFYFQCTCWNACVFYIIFRLNQVYSLLGSKIQIVSLKVNKSVYIASRAYQFY